MTVTAIQIGLDPDVIDYSSADFAQFPGLSKEKLRAANDENVASLRAAGYHVDNCLIDFGAGRRRQGRPMAGGQALRRGADRRRRATGGRQHAAVRDDCQRRTRSPARLPLRVQPWGRCHP